MKSASQGSNDGDGELLYPKHTGCKGKRQRVQWDPQRVQLHPLHPPGYGPDDIIKKHSKTTRQPSVHLLILLKNIVVTTYTEILASCNKIHLLQ